MKNQATTAEQAVELGQLRAQSASLRILAEAHGWQGERDALSLEGFIAQRLRAGAIAETCTSAPSEANSKAWGCYDCGFSGLGFRTLAVRGGEFEAQCPSCGSRNTDEAAQVLRELVATVDSLREEMATAGHVAVTS